MSELLVSFSYIGGKIYMLPYILGNIPQHTCYVEPFAGSLSVLLNKRPARSEVVNDINDDIVNFFVCLKQAPKELVGLLDLPYSRSLFDWWKKELARPEEKLQAPLDKRLEWAMRWYYVRMTSHNNAMQTMGFSKGEKSLAQRYHNSVERLRRVSKRIESVDFQCRPYQWVLERFDTPETLFYVDPPYMGIPDKDQKRYYGVVWHEEEHRELYELLDKLKGKVMLSYYPHPKLQEWYTEPKWLTLQFEIPKHSSSKAAGSTREIGHELLIMNYEPLPMMRIIDKEGLEDESDEITE